MQRTPGVCTNINTRMKRAGLRSQNHSIVFVTSDKTRLDKPTPIYDKASADLIADRRSNAGRMMSAALAVSQEIRVDLLAELIERFWASKPYPILTEKEDAYQPTVRPLNITLKQILKDATFEGDAYTPSVKPLDITLRALLKRRNMDDKDAYVPNVRPLDITLRRILKDTAINGDAYQLIIKPLNITLKRVLIERSIDDNDAYIPSVKPLDITLKTGV